MRLKRVFNIVSIGLIASYVLFLVIEWKNFPAEIPTHFSAVDVPDEFGSKTSLLIEPATMVGLFLLLAIVECFPQIWNIPVYVTKENEAEILTICTIMFGLLKIEIILICAYTGLMCVYSTLPSWPMFFLIVMLLGSIAWSVFRLFKFR